MGIKQCYFNTGQSCSSPTRMLIPENLIKEATEYACNATQKMKTGDPNNEETFLGPISNKTQFEKVQALNQKGIDEGALKNALGKMLNTLSVLKEKNPEHKKIPQLTHLVCQLYKKLGDNEKAKVFEEELQSISPEMHKKYY